MRTAFIETLEVLAEKDPRIMLVVGDLGFSVVEKFAGRFPKQFLNVGVAEQNMAGVAAGLALSGRIVFTYSIANFPTLRCLEQIRNDICYNNANVKVVSVGGGLSYGALGSSHQATEDLAIMRALPNMCVVAPADPIEANAATQAVAHREGPCYLRLGKAGEPRLHGGPVNFQIGKAIEVKSGTDVCMISTGAMLASCLKACELLEQKNMSVRLLSMHTIKPIDADAVINAAKQTSAIITVEEHNVIGGLGGAVAEVLAQNATRYMPFKIMGLRDTFCRDVGGHEYLRRAVGLSVNDIVNATSELLSPTTSPQR